MYRIPLIQKYANTRFKRFFSSLFCICIVGCRIDGIVFILFNILGFLFIEYREWINAFSFSLYNFRIVPFLCFRKIYYVKNNYVFPIRQVSTFRTFDTILCNNVVMSYCHCWTVQKIFFYPKEVLHRQKIYIMLLSSPSTIFLPSTPIFTRLFFSFISIFMIFSWHYYTYSFEVFYPL